MTRQVRPGPANTAPRVRWRACGPGGHARMRCPRGRAKGRPRDAPRRGTGLETGSQSRDREQDGEADQGFGDRARGGGFTLDQHPTNGDEDAAARHEGRRPRRQRGRGAFEVFYDDRRGLVQRLAGRTGEFFNSMGHGVNRRDPTISPRPSKPREPGQRCDRGVSPPAVAGVLGDAGVGPGGAGSAPALADSCASRSSIPISVALRSGANQGAPGCARSTCGLRLSSVPRYGGRAWRLHAPARHV